MTAIIGIKRKNRIIIGADSITSYIDTNDNSIIENTSLKIKRIDGSPSCLIACTGNANNINAVVNVTNLLDGKENVSHSYMIKYVVPKLFKECANRGFLERVDDHDELNMRILIATKKNLYYINDVGTVVDIKKCVFIGSGQSQLTNAYLNINDDNRDLKEIAIDCLDSTCRTCIGIGYPLTIGENDKEKQIEIIEENH